MGTINWRFHIGVFLIVAGGAGTLAAAELRPELSGVKEVLLVVSGALLGLVSLSVEEILRSGERNDDRRKIDDLSAKNESQTKQIAHLTTLAEAREEREEFRSETKARTAYTLGYSATILPLIQDSSIQAELTYLRNLCSDVGLWLSDEEREMLNSPPSNKQQAIKIQKMLLLRSQRLPQELWSFFQFGNVVPWLLDQVNNAQSTHAALDWLEKFQVNPYLQSAPHFRQVVGNILEAVRPYSSGIPDGKRETLEQNVNALLEQISVVYVQDRGTRSLAQRTPWIWAQDHGVGVLTCKLENPNFPERTLLFVVRDANNYEIQDMADESTSTHVTRDETGWHCSVDRSATATSACPHIQLVLDVTDGGNPPSVGAVVPVRTVSDNSPDGIRPHDRDLPS
jgi:hypothetical protein